MTWFLVVAAIVGWLFAFMLLSVVASAVSIAAHKQVMDNMKKVSREEQEVDEMLRKLFRWESGK